MVKLCTISSGSKGNCVIVSTDKTTILIDMGISVDRLERALLRLNYDIRLIDGVLITHTHNDHIKGVVALVQKYRTTIYCHTNSCSALIKSKVDIDSIKVFNDEDFFLKDFVIASFFVNHDVPCRGFCLYAEGLKMSYATDLGCCDMSTMLALKGSDIVVLESNFDPVLLKNSNYPNVLKNRILSKRGHLSNSDCADMVVELAKSGTKNFILAHLSQENNYPELVYDSVANSMIDNGLNIKNYCVEIATQDNLSKVFELY